jgi:hypothetical protein
MIEFPELTKYIKLKLRGSSASEVAIAAREDGLGSIESIFLLKEVFELSTAQAKELWNNLEGNEHHLAFHEQLMDDLDKINEEDALENQGGIS